MTTPPPPGPTAPASRQLTIAFPQPGPAVRNAYRELLIMAIGDDTQQAALGDPAHLPRPWEPASCTQPDLREQLWAWLEDVVTWLNREYTWDPETTIPPCWPHHPHLVHDIAVLADQRRSALLALTSDPLEEWHRYTLPAFTERLRARLKTHCQTQHHPTPSGGRQARHTSPDALHQRHHAFTEDIAALKASQTNQPQPQNPTARLQIVGDEQLRADPYTGELKEE